MKILDIKIPKYAVQALKMLENAGFEAWCVGGCVRDSIRGAQVHDWDICTSALPEQTLAVFDGLRTIPTGLKHGTVTVIIDGEQVEITTYRTDGDYLDHRRPESVQFVRDIRSDLERRDFTINAMCLSLRGELFDGRYPGAGRACPFIGLGQSVAGRRYGNLNVRELRIEQRQIFILYDQR